jgi:RNA polymerase primary sigma factor
MDNGEQKAITIYMQEIGEARGLSREEETYFGQRAMKGDEEARRALIQNNLRLVVKIAHDYKGYGVPLLDLISEGNIGLMKAVDRYDPAKGKFSTYAAWWIRQTMRRALMNQSRTIRLPAHMLEKITRLRKMEETLHEKLGRQPTDRELSIYLKETPETIRLWREYGSTPAPLNATYFEDDGMELMETIRDAGAEDPYCACRDNQLAQDLEDVLSRLDEREQAILRRRFGLDGEGCTLESLGDRFDITRERVRQIQNLALTKLRSMMRDWNRSLEPAIQPAVRSTLK